MSKLLVVIKKRMLISFIVGIIAVLVITAGSAALLYASTPEPTIGSIVIDAGHGGIDSGVTGVNSGTTEAEVNLALAQQLQTSLEEMGFEVIMTRSDENGLYGSATENLKMADLTARKAIINEAQPDLIISIHCNQFPSSDRRGAQTFFDISSEAGQALAEAVQSALNELNEREIGKTYDALSGEYYILECSDYPSIIVESGFMSNAEDDALLTDPTYQAELVTAFCTGILAYLGA
ncbi:MAG: N-acetylmuramoyl-L-alanine amidase [Bacillota bacterium]